MKKPSISTVIIFIIILLAVGGLVFLNKPKQTEAPTETSTSTINIQVNTNL